MKWVDIKSIGTSRSNSRLWYNVKTNHVIEIDFGDNHSSYVIRHPEEFGISSDDVTFDYTCDYDGRILKTVMDIGWVRIKLDPKNPLHESNVEGIRNRDVRKCVGWLTSYPIEFKKIIVVERHSTENRDGTAWILNGVDEIEHFIRFGNKRISSGDEYGSCKY